MVPGLHGAFFSSLLSSASNVTGKKKKKKSKKANLTFCSWKVASHLILTFFFFPHLKNLASDFLPFALQGNI